MLLAQILVVDDTDFNRDMLVRKLKRQGHDAFEAENGLVALELLDKEDFDLVLLDIMMPEMDGYEVLERMKADPRLRETPVIVISAVDQIESVVRCIELGAEDYLSKPFDPVLLRARTNACLEKRRLRVQEIKNQQKIATQLAEAANYVQSLLPNPLPDGDVKTDWRYIPSAQLGGDAFSYYWLDPDHFAFFLLDVCGHGVGPALLSVSVINLLRSQTLKNTDFSDPASVLTSINKAFPREKHNNKHFSMWYGVYDRRTRMLTYASGGHPPALLLQNDRSVEQLCTPGLILGCFAEAVFKNGSRTIESGARLYLYSDGVYEINKSDGEVMELEEFVSILQHPGTNGTSEVDRLYNELLKINGSPEFVDDFSLVEITF